MPANFFISHSLDTLVNRLILSLGNSTQPLLQPRTIIVPNLKMKEWLTLEIAKRTGIAMGFKFLQINEFYPVNVTRSEIFCLTFSELKKSTDKEICKYLGEDPKRLFELADELSSLFFSYGQYGKSLFEEEEIGWQEELLKAIFVKKNWRLPVQTIGQFSPKEPVICFGVDFLAPVYWDFLFKGLGVTAYLFSPCAEFWDDLCSDRERLKLNRYWKKKGTSEKAQQMLDTSLRSGPKMLANWGKLGRQTLQFFDQYSLDTEELYPLEEPNTVLTHLQSDLLQFIEPCVRAADDSIKILLTGTSRMKEVEAIRDEILRLDVPYDEISIMAADIEPYVPLIEYVFGDLIPYRISGFDSAPQSPFRQALVSLLELASGRWEKEEVLAFFAKMKKWDERKLEEIGEMISYAQIEWGFDSTHRQKVLHDLLGEKEYEDFGSWEKGISRLIDAIIYLRPIRVSADFLNELLNSLLALRKVPLSGEKTLPKWADAIEETVSLFLECDLDDPVHKAFTKTLQMMRAYPEEEQFPLAVVRKLLLKPCPGQIHSSQLHAVRVSPIDEGALLPAKAVFLIGMSEGNFPRLKNSSSLDLLKGKAPSIADTDRYLFLQTIFSAKKYLRISYGHLSPEEGKPVGPSLLVQELMSALDPETSAVYKPMPTSLKENQMGWPAFTKAILPEGEITLSISELKALVRHPWKFYLQKAHGIYLDEPLDDSYYLQKGKLASLLMEKNLPEALLEIDLPKGPFGLALQQEAIEEVAEMKAQMASFEIDPFTLLLQENCQSLRFEEGICFAPALEMQLDKLKVRIIGEVKNASRKGLICKKDDTASLLKLWPEALIAAFVLEAPSLVCLKNGKEKPLGCVEQSLKALLEYYFAAISAPSPLLPVWADAILRKDAAAIEKVMNNDFAFDDPITNWVTARIEKPNAEQILTTWGPYLKETFASLYGGKNATV